MPLGSPSDIGTVNQGDSAELYSYVYEDSGMPTDAANIDSVDFIIQRPDESKVTLSGTIQADGAGFLRYNDTDDLGEYLALARFTLHDGTVTSSRIDFQVVDPFDPVAPTPTQAIAEATWMLLEDCFDSEEGGPWLRDMTLAYFNQSKVAAFIPYAMIEINATQPMTHLTANDFAQIQADGSPNPALPIAAMGTLIQVIRHLMRSYVEQPTTQGAQVVYEDRRDYLQRWASILQMIEPDYQRLVILWKRQFLNLGKSALLVHSKAGRLYGPGAPNLRARFPGRGFGW